jgi:hypothetical protein
VCRVLCGAWQLLPMKCAMGSTSDVLHLSSCSSKPHHQGVQSNPLSHLHRPQVTPVCSQPRMVFNAGPKSHRMAIRIYNIRCCHLAFAAQQEMLAAGTSSASSAAKLRWPAMKHATFTAWRSRHNLAAPSWLTVREVPSMAAAAQRATAAPPPADLDQVSGALCSKVRQICARGVQVIYST